jgi:predicted regulator of amino acid metabolism with ACT domain
MHKEKRGIMAKTAIGLFKDSPTADKVVARLLKSGFSRDELRLVSRVDFDGDAETEILKIAALLKDDAGR